MVEGSLRQQADDFEDRVWTAINDDLTRAIKSGENPTHAAVRLAVAAARQETAEQIAAKIAAEALRKSGTANFSYELGWQRGMSHAANIAGGAALARETAGKT